MQAEIGLAAMLAQGRRRLLQPARGGAEAADRAQAGLGQQRLYRGINPGILRIIIGAQRNRRKEVFMS